jgi:hypothetical protein
MLGGGCAAVIVKKLPPGDTSSVEGIRFYRPAPYLMVSDVSTDSKQGSTGDQKKSSKRGDAAGDETSSTQTVQFRYRLDAGFVPGIHHPGEAGHGQVQNPANVRIVDVIPAEMSTETNQDSELILYLSSPCRSN